MLRVQVFIDDYGDDERPGTKMLCFVSPDGYIVTKQKPLVGGLTPEDADRLREKWNDLVDSFDQVQKERNMAVSDYEEATRRAIWWMHECNRVRLARRSEDG